MHILGLPNEILQEILAHSVAARAWVDAEWREQDASYPWGTPRALRLRLVCKHFDALFQAALFDTRLLDRYYPHQGHDLQVSPTLQNWSIRRNHGAQKLWHSYLVYRVQNENDPTVHRFVELRRIAEAIGKRGDTGMELKHIIDALCWLALENVGKKTCDEATESNAGLLSAAAYLGCFELVRTLLLEGSSPTRDDGLFPCAVQAAAWAGDIEMLQFLQEALQESGPADDDGGYRWHPSLGYVCLGGRGESEAMVGAAMRGDVKMLHLAFHPSTSYVTPPSSDTSTPTNGSSSMPVRRPSGAVTNPTHAVLAAMQHAKTLEVYVHLASFFPDFFSQYPDQAGRHLELYAEYGNEEIVRYLLDTGVPVGGSRAPFHPTPLHHAARRSYADIVKLLLDRGADVRKYCRQLGDPLFAAVDGGDVSIVSALFERGALCNYSTLQQAVFSERTDLIDLMMRKCTLLEWHMPKVLDSARKAGLHSMVEYVEKSRATA